MRRKFQGKLLFLLLVFGLAFINFNVPIKSVSAEDNNFVDQYQLQQGTSRLYVVNLTSNANLFINCSAYYKGVFYMFIFDERPLEGHVLRDGSIDASITESAAAYNETPSLVFSEELNDTVSFITLNFTAPVYQLYYVEIFLIENGPDTFRLESSYAMQAYYVPFIPGYNIEVIASCAISAIFLIFLKIRKQRK